MSTTGSGNSAGAGESTEKEKRARNPEFDVVGGDIPRHLFPLGRIKFSLGANGKEAETRRDRMRQLRRDQEWEILKAIADHRIAIPRVEEILKRNGTSGLHRYRLFGQVPGLSHAARRMNSWRTSAGVR